jgi:excisionase family DNA binding protein
MRAEIDLSKYPEHVLRRAHMVVVPPGVVVPAGVAAELLAALEYAYRTSGKRPSDRTSGKRPSDRLELVMAELRMVVERSARVPYEVPPSVPEVDDPDDGRQGWITTSEAARRLGVTDRAIRGRIARNTIEHRRRGRWEVRLRDDGDDT